MRSPIRVAAVVATVSLVVVGWMTIDHERSSAGSPTSRAGFGGFAGLGGATAIRDLTPGIEHVYTLEMEHRVTPAGGKPFIVRVGGEWSVAVMGDALRGTVLRAELRDGVRSVVGDGGVVTAVESPGLQRPYFMTLATDGSIVALQFETSVPAEARAALAAATASAQVVVADLRAATWEATERDPLGPYQATYRRDDRSRLRKAKTSYAVTGMASAEVMRSSATIALRGDGWPASIEASEAIRVGTEQVKFTDESRFNITHIRSSHRVPTGVPLGFVTVTLDMLGASARATEEEDRKLLAGASLDELLAELVLADGDLEAKMNAYLRLATLFRIDPKAAQAASKAVIDGLDARRASTVIGALSRAGTAEAQKALGGVLDTSRLDVATRERAAVALGMTSHPTPETITNLTAIAAGKGHLADSALLAVGTTAHNGGRFDPLLARTTVDSLLAKLGGARDDDERERILRALGNTGDPRIQAALEAALGSGSIELRIVAIVALRLLPGVAVDALLVRALADPVIELRNAVVFAAGHRDLSPLLVDALASAGRHDPVAGIRQQIVELAGARIRIAGLRAMVEWAATNDRDPNVRTAARAALAPGSTSGP